MGRTILIVFDILPCGKLVIKLDMIRIIKRTEKCVRRVGEQSEDNEDYQKGSTGMKLLIDFLFFIRFNFESNLVNNFSNDVDKRIRRLTSILVTQV